MEFSIEAACLYSRIQFINDNIVYTGMREEQRNS